MLLCDYIGIPYLDKGRDRTQGLDCWGLVKTFLADTQGVAVPDYLELYTRTDEHLEKERAINFKDWYGVTVLQYADLLIFRIAHDWWHAGIYVGEGKMLHTLRGNNSCIEKIGGIKWRDRLMGAYRCKS